MGDYVAQSELICGDRVKIDDDSIIGGREAHREGENLVLVADSDASLFQAKSKGLDFPNPCLNRLGGVLLRIKNLQQSARLVPKPAARYTLSKTSQIECGSLDQRQ